MLGSKFLHKLLYRDKDDNNIQLVIIENFSSFFNNRIFQFGFTNTSDPYFVNKIIFFFYFKNIFNNDERFGLKKNLDKYFTRKKKDKPTD